MYYHTEVRGHRIPLDVSEQQRDHVAEASAELARQEANKKARKGRVRYV